MTTASIPDSRVETQHAIELIDVYQDLTWAVQDELDKLCHGGRTVTPYEVVRRHVRDYTTSTGLVESILEALVTLGYVATRWDGGRKRYCPHG